MDTFNLAIIFGQAEAVVTFVCASETALDRGKINQVATKYFQQGILIYPKIKQVVDYMTRGIAEECGCNVVPVAADVACIIPRH